MKVVLDAFEGPLDLLLHLIEKNEIDIYDIPMAVLTTQYIEVLKENRNPLDSMSEFILMAATLLEIKSRMLLPKPPQPATEEDADPRAALVRKLLEYKRCQALAAQLRDYASTGERVVREARFVPEDGPLSPEVLLAEVPLSQLFQLFNEVIRRRELRIDRVRAKYGDMPRERFTVDEKIAQIAQYLTLRNRFRLSELFEICYSKEEMLVTFLALLEMIRLKQLRVQQREAFGDIACEGRADARKLSAEVHSQV